MNSKQILHVDPQIRKYEKNLSSTLAMKKVNSTPSFGQTEKPLP